MRRWAMRQALYNLSLSVLSLFLCLAVAEGTLRVLDFDKQIEFDLDDQLY